MAARGADNKPSLRTSYYINTAAKDKNKMLHRISAKPKKPSLITSNLADHRTTSSRSEASSCNSQTALVPRNGSQAKQKRGRRLMFLGFVCHGPCFDKKDVRIDNHHHNQLPTRARFDHLALADSVKLQQEEVEEIEIDLEESRNSIQVFGSGATLENMERKLSMLTWDAIPRARNTPDADDVASDASSDLFEIETISGPAHSRIMPSTSPSEASIQWSVVAGDVMPRTGCESAQRPPWWECRS